MSLLANVEAKLEAVWHEITGEARADLEAALAAVKAEEAKLAPIVQTAEAEIKQLIATAEPEIAKAVESRLGQLVADVLALIGAPAGM